jgi:hypothetical protein
VPPDPTLYAPVATETYGPADRERLLDALDAQDRHTVMGTLDGPDQILLDRAGRTKRGGFRLSPVAFRQLCRTACPGLSDVVADLAGVRRRAADADRSAYDLADAIHVLNTAVARRFGSTLEGLQTVRDARTGVLEGIVGRNYQRLANVDLCRRSHEVLRGYRLPAEFNHAVLAGRYLVLHYRESAPLGELPGGPRGPDVFHAGFYYGNSEVGAGAVRAAPTLVRAGADTKSLGNFGRRGRLVHAGRDFPARFERLLDGVVERRADPARVLAALARLAARPLGFDGDADRDETRYLALVATFYQRRVTQGLAKRFVRDALLQGSHDRTPLPEARLMDRAAWRSRTAYDLYNALGRVARTLPIAARERAEQLANDMLTDRFNPCSAR